MLKKVLVFGLVAAAMAIAPTAAFANEQYQENRQVTEQSGAAINGSTNAQSSRSINVQQQINKNSRLGRHSCGKLPTTQSQRSSQYTGQSGAATDGSVNAQDGNTVNTQRQVSVLRSGCYSR